MLKRDLSVEQTRFKSFQDFMIYDFLHPNSFRSEGIAKHIIVVPMNRKCFVEGPNAPVRVKNPKCRVLLGDK